MDGDPIDRFPNRANGRDAAGRFTSGCKGGPGNPHMARVARLRQAMFDAVTDADLKAIVKVLVQQAKAGDVVSAKEVLDRLLGKPVAAVQLQDADGGSLGDLVAAVLGALHDAPGDVRARVAGRLMEVARGAAAGANGDGS